MTKVKANIRFWFVVYYACTLTAVPALAADVSVQGTSIIDNQTGAPIRGFHAMYQNVPSTRAGIEADLDAMKNQFALKGFSFEIGWHEAEPSRGTFHWDPSWDLLLDIAHEKGLYVNLLLTAHYTPNWVYNQGIDVHVKDENGNNVNSLWLNYAPASPAALVWQGDFQRAALQHFKNEPALLSVNLTNEVTYGTGAWRDYSSFAQAGWTNWLAAHGLPNIPMPKAETASASEWVNWSLFRQDQMNQYFNTSYDNVRPALTANDHLLIFHRENWYAAGDAYARQHGVYFDPNLKNKGDVMGGNNYGTSDLMAGMMVAAGKPIFLTETSLVALDNGSTPPSPGDINQRMLTQFFQGAQNQTVYRFDYGSYYPMRLNATTPHPSFAQFKQMTQIVEKIQEVQLDSQRQVGYLWPRVYAGVGSSQYWNVQSLYSDLMSAGRKVAESPVVVYPSFFTPNQPSEPLVNSLKLVYALRHYGYDQATINSSMLRDWVSAGGTLFIELDQNSGIPSWLTGVSASTTTRTAFSTNAASPFGVVSNISKREGQWRISGLDTIWATWNGSGTQAAAGVENFGQGKVVLLGSNVLNNGEFDPLPGMDKYVFGDEHVNQSWQYYRAGHNVLALPEAGSNGPVYIPVNWLGASLEAYVMDLTSGVFTSINWSSISNDRYVFNIPANSLLLGITLTPLPGDYDSDGDVDGADFVIWQTHFPTASGASLATGDTDGDGDVDGADFVVWQTHFPTLPGPGGTSTAEPASGVLAALVAAVLWRVRRNTNPLYFINF